MFRRLLFATTKRWGTRAAKQRVWDAEYMAGRWTSKGLNQEGADPIYTFLERHGEGGRILDLGCGSGTKALTMKDNFLEYVGVDISSVAVEKACAALKADPGRATKVRFFKDDIFSFVPSGQFSVILFSESIYYVPRHLIGTMLKRYSLYLRPGGCFIIRICDRQRFRSITGTLERKLHLVEKYIPGEESGTAIFICVP